MTGVQTCALPIYIGQSDEYDVRRRNHRRDCGYAIDPTKANHYKYSESQFYGFINKNGGWDRVEMNGGHFEIIDKTDSDDEATKLETQYIKAIPRNHLCLNTERFPSPPCRRVEQIDPRQKKITDLFKSVKNAI